MKLDHDEKLRICEAMRVYGGSFAKALSECFILADRYCVTYFGVLQIVEVRLFPFPTYK